MELFELINVTFLSLVVVGLRENVIFLMLLTSFEVTLRANLTYLELTAYLQWDFFPHVFILMNNIEGKLMSFW